MSATVNFKNVHRASINTQVIKTIKGVKYIHYNFASGKHDVSIKINDVTYYKLQD